MKLKMSSSKALLKSCALTTNLTYYSYEPNKYAKTYSCHYRYFNRIPDIIVQAFVPTSNNYRTVSLFCFNMAKHDKIDVHSVSFP